MSYYSLPSCARAYDEERETFEAVLYFSGTAWLFLSVLFLPKNDAQQQQRRRCCDCLIPCLRAMTFCLNPCRPLLDNDTVRATEAARAVGTSGSVAFLSTFLLLQLVPPVALVAGIFFFYPNCGCENEDQEYCKCTLTINLIPVGTCTVFAIFLTSIISLASLAFFKKAIHRLGLVRNAASYSNVSVGTESTVDVAEQELV